jgi:hypothetical protein
MLVQPAKSMTNRTRPWLSRSLQNCSSDPLFWNDARPSMRTATGSLSGSTKKTGRETSAMEKEAPSRAAVQDLDHDPERRRRTRHVRPSQ